MLQEVQVHEDAIQDMQVGAALATSRIMCRMTAGTDSVLAVA